ncbi:NifU family protein [Streptomyces sp. NPDC006739]|uniref:NifU family protein n=1 Tax=Streptomyces sp. NPDC006739 TaxID=3364763 RepID=UPI003679ECC3
MADGDRLDEASVAERLTLVDELLERLERTPGPTAREAVEAVRALAEVYGEALARTLDRAGPALAGALADDELLGHLLVLHGIHPEPVGPRVDRAVERLRRDLRERGGDLELVGIDGAVARVRLSAKGCGSSTAGVLAAVEETLLAVAPELERVEPVQEAAAPAFVPLDALTLRSPQPQGAP